ncbi:hypothetical protein BU204_26870 [Actinophytocola xanthii]|uniref:Guanylate cyclase domain-containing protein n=1 Tax=Actinophytocola xanthii TaxID=1912961 RepID=A0A1Q8CGS1_9PSEU|nr:hypothetical protein BU204_26870 [Actinophytocola xanthii]
MTAPGYRTIVVVDVVGFTDPRRTSEDRSAVRHGLYQILETAFAESDIDLGLCDLEDRGDGALILVPQQVPRRTVADRLPDRIVAALRRYNWTRKAWAQFRLRVGLNSGDVVHDGNGWLGTAIDTAFRILDCPDAKALLTSSARMVALISSESFFQEVIAGDPGTFPESYQQVPVTVKTYTGTAHLRLLGEPTAGEPPTLAPVATSTSAPKSAPTGTLATRPPAPPSSRGDVLEVIPAAELRTLRDHLSVTEVPRLAILLSRAAGPAIPLPRREDVHDAWEAFEYLMDFNAGPDGIPPAVLFLELLAGELDGEAGEALAHWIGEQAGRWRLGPALEKQRLTRTPLPDEPHLHLTLMVDLDPIDPSRCVLASWRQDDPEVWPPPLGGVREVAMEELEYRVDEAILDAEDAWWEQGTAAAVEFVLPRTLLHLPVLRWRKEHVSGKPHPLRYDYRINIRSLERMRARYWHRIWHRRWDSMLEDPSADRLHYSGSSEFEEHPIDAVLSDPHWVGLVMREKPAARPEASAGPDEFLAALRCGLPVVLWHPEAGPEELRELLDWVLGGESGFIDLPARRKLAGLPTSWLPGDSLAHDLVVMWEDPKRVIVLDQPLIPNRG